MRSEEDSRRPAPQEPNHGASRLFIDPLYIDPRQVPGFASSPVAHDLNSPGIGERLDKLRDAEFVDHAAVWSLKRDMLGKLWSVFVQSSDNPFLTWDALRRTANVRSVVAYDLASGKTLELLPETMVGSWDISDDGATLTVSCPLSGLGRMRVTASASVSKPSLTLGSAACADDVSSRPRFTR